MAKLPILNTIQLSKIVHPDQTQDKKFKIGSHLCTGYNPYHLDTNEQVKRKGRLITKVSKVLLDGAVAAINRGEAIFRWDDGRNDYVEYNGYIYGVHRQVFEGIRQMFPHQPVETTSSSSEEDFDEKKEEKIDEEEVVEEKIVENDEYVEQEDSSAQTVQTRAQIIFKASPFEDGWLDIGTKLQRLPATGPKSFWVPVQILDGTYKTRTGLVMSHTFV